MKTQVIHNLEENEYVHYPQYQLAREYTLPHMLHFILSRDSDDNKENAWGKEALKSPSKTTLEPMMSFPAHRHRVYCVC